MPKGNPMGYLKKGAKNRVPVKKKKNTKKNGELTWQTLFATFSNLLK